MTPPDSPHPGSQPPPAALLREMIGGYRCTQLIYAAAKLGIADLLSNGPKSSHELAESAGVQPGPLYRVLRALAGLGVFAENEEGAFALTPMAQLLQTGVPGSLRPWALVNGGEWQRAWGELAYSLQTGKPSFDCVFGLDLWDYLAGNSPARETFNAAMSENIQGISQEVLAAYDFSGMKTVVDVGGGQGALITAILEAYPGMQGILFDLRETIGEARSSVEDSGVGHRCALVEGDYFNAVPRGGDAYLLKWIVHDWDDAHALAILGSCRHALADNGKLLMVERVIPPGNTPSEDKLVDIMLMTLLGGQERTEAEYRSLFETAGLRLTRVIPTRSPFSIIEGTPL